MCYGQFSQALRRPKHLICIPADPGPPEGADLIDDLSRVGAVSGQIATMKGEVWGKLAEVSQNRLKGAPIAVDIRHNCDSHFVPSSLSATGKGQYSQASSDRPDYKYSKS